MDFLAQLEGALDGEPEMDQQYLGQGHLGYAQYALTYQAGETLSQEIQIGLELNPGVGELVQKAQPFFAVIDESISQRALFLRQQPLSHLAGPFLLTDSKGQVGVAHPGELRPARQPGGQGAGLGVYQVLPQSPGGTPG